MFLLSHANRPPLASRKDYQARPGQPEDRAFGPTQIHSGFGLNDPSFKCFAEIRSSANILVSRGACCPPVRPGALTVSPDMRAPGRCRSPLLSKIGHVLVVPENFQCAAHCLVESRRQRSFGRQLRTGCRPMRGFRTEIAAWVKPSRCQPFQ